MVALLLIVIDNKTLLFKRSGKETNNSGKYGLIGGGIEKGETPEKALEREVKEEAGVTVTKFHKLKKYHIDGEEIHVFYTNKFDVDKIKLNPEHTSYKFFEYDDLSDPSVIKTNKRFVHDYNLAVTDYKMVTEEVNRLKTIMGINEAIAPSEANGNVPSIQTILDGKRNVGTVYFTKEMFGTDEYNKIANMINRNGLNTIHVKSNPHKLYIVYKPGHEKEAEELNSIAERYGGYLSPHATASDTYRIGSLLGYHKAYIEDFVNTHHMQPN